MLMLSSSSLAVVVVVGVIIIGADAGAWGPEKVKQRSGYFTVNNSHVDNGTALFSARQLNRSAA